ncbi:MAG: type IV secretion system DNA-binding domain-containing protein [Patescibacteria group bacterium]|nr:type IV secretion system DNA-binding domain-containing protein [Patescibacteria group bacterium]
MPNIHLRAKGAEEKKQEDICVFAQTNYRNQLRKFGIKTDDRRRHMYVIGKTGMGKTTMMENMVLNDIYKGHGVGIVDPHGDFAEKIIDFIPNNRINDVVYFNPADVEYPIGFNILEVNSEEQKHLVAAGLMGIFKKIWPDVWSSRMEYILNNTILALLDYPGSTLLGINRLLSDKDYRRKVVKQLKDPIVKAFWQVEFASYNDRYAQEAVAPIQNKIGQFLSASVIRNIVAQVKSTINVREIMDSGKILIMNLSKGRIGEDNSRLLGNMLITEIQLAAMERVDMPENERNDFFLYVDEFQNFATPSFANILSEARKYRLSLIMAHQYVAQLDELVSDAVFGNVGSIVTFRVGAADSEILAKEFAPTFIEQDIVNLSKFRVILKLMIDGVASDPFSAMTIPPIGSRTGSAEKVIRVSRERYAKHRDIIADKILRWSGMGGGDSSALDDDDDDDSDDVDTTLEDKTVEKNNKKIEDKVTEVVENLEEEKINNVLDFKKSEESKPNDEEIISFDKAPNIEKIVNENNNKEEKKELVVENLEDGLLPGLDYRIESKKIETKPVQPQKNEEAVDLLPGLIKNDNLSFSQNSVNNNESGDTPKKKKRKRNRKKKSSNGLPQTNIVNNPESKSDSVQPKKIQADDIIKFD